MSIVAKLRYFCPSLSAFLKNILYKTVVPIFARITQNALKNRKATKTPIKVVIKAGLKR